MKRRFVLIGAAGGAVSLLTACAEPFFFHPDRRTYTLRQSVGSAVEDVFFDSAGSRLHAWWMPAGERARATVVHAHGNAANVSNHVPQVSWLPREGFNVLSFDYRGFGYSDGVPSLDGVVADTRAALAEARRRAPELPLILLGQSLGGATAIRAVAEEPVDGDIRLLVVDSAFASYRGVVRDATQASVLALIAPLASSTLPGRSRDPAQAMAKLRLPVLILHGEKDRVVPIEHGERLLAAAAGPKEFIRIPQGRHLDALTREDVRQRVLAAMEAALVAGAASVPTVAEGPGTAAGLVRR